MVALQAMGAPTNSSLRNLEQIPFSEPFPPTQNLSSAEDEEETPSMKRLVPEIDSHAEPIDLEVTSDFNTMLRTDPLPSPKSGA